MPALPVQESELSDLVVRALVKDGFTNPREVRRIVNAACDLLGIYLREGHRIHLPGAFTVEAEFLTQRRFRSNLPNLHGEICLSMCRARLKVKPDRDLKRLLRFGLIGC